MPNNDDNIFFFVEEKEKEKEKENEKEKEKEKENDNVNKIEQMLFELEELDDLQAAKDLSIVKDLEPALIENIYNVTKKLYDEDYGINNTEFYEQYTIKELLKIWRYYDVEKHVKFSKCTKNDIISCIVYFESLSENESIVLRRHMMWSYILELRLDPKMKKYIIW